MKARHATDGLQPTGDGLLPTSDGLQPRSNGLQPNSNQNLDDDLPLTFLTMVKAWKACSHEVRKPFFFSVCPFFAFDILFL